MNNIDKAITALAQRNIDTEERQLNEMLRVKMTQKSLTKSGKLPSNDDRLFQLMKKFTENELGMFPADRSDFAYVYNMLLDVDPIDFAVKVYKDGRSGLIMLPLSMLEYVSDRITELKPDRVLITEAEKYLVFLRNIVKKFPKVNFVFSTDRKSMEYLFELAFEDCDNVKTIFASIYAQLPETDHYDYIASIPNFGSKQEALLKSYKTTESDGIALENLLEVISPTGTLDIVMPARAAFAMSGFEDLRKRVTEGYYAESLYILPDGIFRPYTSVKAYLIAISAERKERVEMGTLELSSGLLKVKESKKISTQEFKEQDDWRIEPVISNMDDYISSYRNSAITKIKLKEAADIFRGKSILKDDVRVGDISVLNISNIEDGEIVYDNLDTIDEEPRKIKRYELQTGDVLLSARGTQIKTSVFKQQEKPVIASANLIVIRPDDKLLPEYIKIFFESPVGQALVRSFQRGTAILNINYTDIMEIELPYISKEQQLKLVTTYDKARVAYKDVIIRAETKWSEIKDKIYSHLIK